MKTSRHFDIPLGIKQGGINSPDLFSCYIDGLIQLLRSKKIGCKMYLLYLAIILFADDICLLAPTRSALEKLISMCSDYCKPLGIMFNQKKSKILVFSKSKVELDSLMPICLDGKDIEYTDSVRYLGVLIVSNRGFSVSAKDDIRFFYRA